MYLPGPCSVTLSPSFPAMRRDLALGEQNKRFCSAPGAAALHGDGSYASPTLPRDSLLHRLQLSLSNAEGLVSKKQKEGCNTESGSGECAQSFKHLPLLVGPRVQPHRGGAPLHSVPRKEGKFCMDPLKHQPLSASSSKRENQSSEQKRFLLQQLYRNNLKQLRGGPEKQQLLRVCVGGTKKFKLCR